MFPRNISLHDHSRDEIKTQVKGDLKSLILCLKTNNSNNKKDSVDAKNKVRS